MGEVGRGGMGAVLKIWDEDLRRTLAMKVVLGKDDPAKPGSTPSVDSRTLGRFLEEAQVTGQLDHPGIVPVHELGLDSTGRVYFTMRLVKGEDLRRIYEHVESGHDGWNETRALGVLLKVCEAMSYAHDKNVVHRDLKPANVMVGKFGEVYVMDWGLARVLGEKDRHDVRLKPEAATSASIRTERRSERDETPDSPLVTMDGDVVGTPAYMPPEQARGDVDQLGPHSDVYAVGAMLYHLLAKQMPFVPANARVSAHAVLMRVLDGPPRPLIELTPRAPAELVAICERAMERDPARRYHNMVELAGDLRAYLERRVVKAYESGTWAETKKWVLRNKPLAAALASAVLIAIGGFAWVSAKNADLAAANTTIQAKTEEVQAKNATLVLSEREARLRGMISELTYFETLDDDVYAYARKQSRPASEWWLERAHELVDGVAEDPARNKAWSPGLRDVEEALVKVRAGALERTPEEVAQDRSSNPRLQEFEKKREELLWYSRMLGTAAWPVQAAVEAELSKDELPREASELNSLAWNLVDPAAPVLGQEVKALLLARRAVAAAQDDERARVRDTLAWALYRCGRLEEALAEEQKVVEEAADAEKEELTTSKRRLHELVSSWRGADSRSKREEEATLLASQVTTLDGEVSQRRTWRFASSQDEWWNQQLTELEAGLHRLQKQIELGEQSVHGAENARAWSEAIAAIAASEQYKGQKWPGGDRLTPQLGLVPIGADPETGMWEFAHLATGEPARRGLNGKLVLDPEMGLVLVLLPGDRVPVADSADQHQDASLTKIDLDPFFLSKYEMTMGQWYRIGGRVPADRTEWFPNDLFPAASVSWYDCQSAVSRAGWLRLPSEAQWEYGCRAGTTTRWWPSNNAQDLHGVANLRFDPKEKRAVMPIGKLRANRFGLHDVHGNVSEWCGDSHGGSNGARRVGDGLWDTSDTESRILRGFCSDAAGAECALSSWGMGFDPVNRFTGTGLRPARGVSP
ncbi:MAG: SUMF1/EgtB/PvdO family nonheme iron enzyme [Planctomycetes bacterium]|nr:SUMF1/EgtB/PvdO family nonheme iron enzyme [Planctomycetota bacterium]